MMHEERLPVCELFQCDIKRTMENHIMESVPIRDNVSKHCEQILTLNKAHEGVMQDIKDIKDDLKVIREAITGLKVWILTSAVAGLISLIAVALYYGGDKKQIEVNTRRLDTLEEMHPRTSE